MPAYLAFGLAVIMIITSHPAKAYFGSSLGDGSSSDVSSTSIIVTSHQWLKPFFVTIGKRETATPEVCTVIGIDTMGTAHSPMGTAYIRCRWVVESGG